MVVVTRRLSFFFAVVLLHRWFGIVPALSVFVWDFFDDGVSRGAQEQA